METLSMEIMRHSEAYVLFPDYSYYVDRSWRKASNVGGIGPTSRTI